MSERKLEIGDLIVLLSDRKLWRVSTAKCFHEKLKVEGYLLEHPRHGETKPLKFIPIGTKLYRLYINERL